MEYKYNSGDNFIKRCANLGGYIHPTEDVGMSVCKKGVDLKNGCPKDCEYYEKLEGEIMSEKKDAINPDHYKDTGLEPIVAIEEWNLNFNLGNVVKYIARCGKKDEPLQELKKAEWYLKREIERRENNE